MIMISNLYYGYMPIGLFNNIEQYFSIFEHFLCPCRTYRNFLASFQKTIFFMFVIWPLNPVRDLWMSSRKYQEVFLTFTVV